MIAPEPTMGKSLQRGKLGLINSRQPCVRGLSAGGRGEAAASCDTFAAWNHGFVKRIIMRP
jgi:hypothetical protein